MLYTEEAELEEADLFSDPEDDLYQRFCEVRRSLSLDSEGTEPEVHRGHVLSKVAFFEMFQQGMETQSPSHSETSLRRSLIQEELEELASRPKGQSPQQEEEVGEEEEVMEEHECQLEFDDVFPAHREGDEEVPVDEDIFDAEGEDEDESLVSVSEAEDVLDFTDYDTRPEGLQDYEFEDHVCLTHEFTEEEPSAMEITDASHEDISHQHADITEEEDQPLSSTANVFLPTNLSTAGEFQKTDHFKLCEDEPPDLVEDAPDNYREERFETSQAIIKEPRASFQRTLDPEFCYMVSKQENVNIRMKELICKIGLSSVEEDEGASDEPCDFGETMEGKLLASFVNTKKDRGQEDERIPIEETCEASFRDNVESEIDFEALFETLDRDWTEYEKKKAMRECSTEIEKTDSSEIVQVVSRDRESERSACMQQISSDLGLITVTSDDELKEEREAESDITLDYQGTTSASVGGERFGESVREETIEAARRDRHSESAWDLEELQVRVESPTEEKEGEQLCEAVLRDYDQERARVLEETGLELNQVSVSPDVMLSSEPEPLDYQASKSSTASELPEVVEHIDAEVRQDVRSEINFEEIFRLLDEEDAEFADEVTGTQRFEDNVKETVSNEETSRASLYVEEDTTVDEVSPSRCRPTSLEYISHESKQFEPEEEIVEVKQVEKKRPASLYVEENTVVEEVAVESPSSPRHIAAEGLNLDRTEVTSEVKETVEEKRASLILEENEIVKEMDTKAPSSQFVAGESKNSELFEEITEETVSDSGARASSYMDEDVIVQEVSPAARSSPIHLANEYENLHSLKESEYVEQADEEKRASLYMEENSFVDSVKFEVPAHPLHVSGECLNVDPAIEKEATEPSEEEKQAFLYSEETVSFAEVTTDDVRSSQYIACESVNRELVDKVESVVEPLDHQSRASLYMEEDMSLDEIKPEEPLSPKHIAGETVNTDLIEEVVEQHDDARQTSLLMEEESVVDYVTTHTPSSPLYMVGDSAYSKSFEEIYEEVFDEVEKRASLIEDEDLFVHEIAPDTPSSLKHFVQDDQSVEPFEEIDEEPSEESKRASLFLEEETEIVEVQTGTPSSPKHIAGESRNVESFDEIEEEPTDETKRASVFLEEDTDVVQVETDIPSSPKHIAGESRNVEAFEEIDVDPIEENKRASLFLEEDTLVDEAITYLPSSPKHLAGESANVESFEEVQEVPNDENKRASLFVEEDFSVDEVTPSTPAVPIYIAGEALRIPAVKEIHEEATAPVELAQELDESDEEVRYDYAIIKTIDQNNHVAAEVTNAELLEVTDEEESPESDYGEHFEEFESTYGTQRLVEPSQSAHIAGEISNVATHNEAMVDVLQVEESLEYEDSQELVTTTDILETNQSSLHVAVELSNIEPQEESSEEEKPEEEVSAEEIEEVVVRATTVVLKSPQSLLSIAAAALELKIDAAQQVTEVAETKAEITQQYGEEERLDVPVIFVNVADETSDNEDENAYYVEEEPKVETETQEHYEETIEETVVSYKTEEQSVSQSHVAAEFCVSEFTLEIDDVEERTDFAEPFEESEEGSVSELMSECSSSPLHVSSELKDFQDYETISEEYGTETYHAITLEETDYVSEKSFSKGLPSLYITEELSPQEIYEESVLNEKSVVIETAQEYNEVEEPLETETNIFFTEPPLQTAAEFSDSDYNDGVGEDDDLSEREFLDEFEEMDETVGHEIPLESANEPAVSKTVLSGPQIAEEEDELLDETDNAQSFTTQELVRVDHYTRDAERERIVHKEEKIQEEVFEVEEKRVTHEIQKFTVVSEKKEHRSVEIKSSYHVIENRETQRDEHIFSGEEAQRMEISHATEEKVQVIATKTTRQVSSTDSHVATASAEIHYKAGTNGEGILQEEVQKIQEVSFTPIKQTSRQTSWEKKGNGQQFETSDQLSESILEKEVQDQESKKFERQLSEDETEVRLLKSEVMKYKAAEQQDPLTNPHVTVERETKFVKSYVVHSAAKDVQEIQQVIRQEDVTVILKDDEASLEEESAGEQFEEEIDIMRMDEALSEEEFRGEGAENVDRSHSRSSKTDSAEGIDRCDQEEESKTHEDEQKEPLYEEEVDITEVQPIYEEELEMQKVKEQEEQESSETEDKSVITPTFEEEVEIAAYGYTVQAEEENLEGEPAEKIQLRPHSAEFEEELEISTIQEGIEGHIEDCESEGHEVSAVFEEEVEISASREEYHDIVLTKDEEHKTAHDMESSPQCVEEERAKLVETIPTRRQPLDLSQVDLYDDESVTTRYYVELSSTESLEQPYEEVEDEASYTETYVRQGDPLEENLEEFILVRYGDEFESSGEEEIAEQREIYVIPEEENDGDNSKVVESPKEELKTEKELLAESFYEEEFEDMGLEEIPESPEFEIDDSPEDELDEEEQRQLEEYERLESFVILEEKLSQVESDEDCDDENAGFKGEEGDENVFHSDVHSSSEETLHEDELGETMTASSIRQAAVSADAETKEDKKTDYPDSGKHEEQPEDSFARKEEELKPQEGFAGSAVEDISKSVDDELLQTFPRRQDTPSDESGAKRDEKEVCLTQESAEKREHPESRETKDEKTEQNLSSDSSGEQSISSEGSLSSTASVDLEGKHALYFSLKV